ncbi:hypothetical protein KCU71_g16649, partial [Aureobasidium melanogenum]
MHFNAIALTLCLAATLGAAVPVNVSADTNPHSDGIIFPPFPPPFPIRDHGNNHLDIAELPQPVQDRLKSKPTPKEGDQQHPTELPPQEGNGPIYMPHKVIPGHHSEYDFDHLTMNKVCSHGERKMSGARPFRRFEKHVFSAIKRYPEVDMRSLENLFWDVNHQCHKKWMKQTKAPEDLSPKDAGEADVAEEKDEALSDDDE